MWNYRKLKSDMHVQLSDAIARHQAPPRGAVSASLFDFLMVDNGVNSWEQPTGREVMVVIASLVNISGHIANVILDPNDYELVQFCLGQENIDRAVNEIDAADIASFLQDVQFVRGMQILSEYARN